MRVTGVVLASGRGQRLGGPKGLLWWPCDDGEERPLALAHASARLAAECRRVLIVGREQLVRILEPRVSDRRIELLVSRKTEALGPAGSLAVAALRLAQLDADDALLVTPVDCPPAAPETVALLLAALVPGKLAARPRHAGRGGHPVLVRPPLLADYRRKDPPPLRDLLRAQGAAVAEVDTADDRVLVDIDTPDDFVAWCRRVNSPLSAPRFVRAGAPT